MESMLGFFVGLSVDDSVSRSQGYLVVLADIGDLLDDSSALSINHYFELSDAQQEHVLAVESFAAALKIENSLI
ncbi:hypothetical protein L1987_00777 [Smallanthus sonchifolius]|uniref:Uncharacterized protein n=1 Tax=Smallanthus sonchifolius TaxID=185202 RepID=A0ACB9K334_9ASTR|nr:hypothetical protein L1987_00777 [Smallanthus sonchifolius]